MANKKDLKAMAKLSIKIINNSKIKLRKGQKISIKPIVEESLNGAVVSRLEGIIPDNTDKYDASHVIKSEATLLSKIKMCDIISHAPSTGNAVPTVVQVVTKKNALNFDFAGEGIIGDLLRTSTLGPTYNKIKDGWKSLNTDDKSLFTNVLFIPNIFVFSNGIEALFSPFKVNLLLIAVPTFKLFKDDAPEDSKNVETDYIGRVFGDVMDAATKIPGCTDIIINPFDLKITRDFQHEVIDMWNYLLDSSRCRKVVSSIWFSIEDEYNYVLFVTEKGFKKITDKMFSDVIAPNNNEVEGDDDEDDELEDITDEIVSDMKKTNDKKKKAVKDALDYDED